MVVLEIWRSIDSRALQKTTSNFDWIYGCSKWNREDAYKELCILRRGRNLVSTYRKNFQQLGEMWSIWSRTFLTLFSIHTSAKNVTFQRFCVLWVRLSFNSQVICSLNKIIKFYWYDWITKHVLWKYRFSVVKFLTH